MTAAHICSGSTASCRINWFDIDIFFPDLLPRVLVQQLMSIFPARKRGRLNPGRCRTRRIRICRFPSTRFLRGCSPPIEVLLIGPAM